MGQYDCNFCEMGIYNRALAYRIIKDLSRADMQKILRWNLHKNCFDVAIWKKEFIKGLKDLLKDTHGSSWVVIKTLIDDFVRDYSVKGATIQDVVEGIPEK